MRYPGLVAALELPHPDSFVAALDDLGPEPDRKVLHGDLFDLLQRQRQRPRYTGLLARARKAPGYGAGMRPMREVLCGGPSTLSIGAGQSELPWQN